MKRSTITILTAAVAFAFLMYFLFSSNFVNAVFSIMSISFLLLIPFGMGALTIYLSDIEKVKKLSYRIFMPWLPILAFLVLTMIFALEGWACWLMILPIFLAAASAGGCTSGHFKLKKYNNNKAYVSMLLLLPLFAAPVEHLIGAIPGRYEAYTFIDIRADKQTIWDNVTRVKQINKEQDSGWLTKSLGFPRPVKAELNYNGVGAYRKAIFDKGLIFHEEVYRYEEGKRMDFTIKANPYEIPSTTMDKHVVIGGDYFDVLNGTYILQQTGDGKYRLHLYSHFKLTTTFNFYASWWAGWIMSDIQNNILQVIKQRAEH